MDFFYADANDIDTLIEGFNAKTLPKEQWTHAAHLTGAVWYLRKYNFEQALQQIRIAITTYNIAVGGQNTATSGYYETMTVFWMQVVDFFVRTHQAFDLRECCNALLASPLAERTLPFYFYEKDTILSQQARAAFVPADKLAVNDDNLGMMLKKNGILLNSESV